MQLSRRSAIKGGALAAYTTAVAAAGLSSPSISYQLSESFIDLTKISPVYPVIDGIVNGTEYGDAVELKNTVEKPDVGVGNVPVTVKILRTRGYITQGQGQRVEKESLVFGVTCPDIFPLLLADKIVDGKPSGNKRGLDQLNLNFAWDPYGVNPSLDPLRRTYSSTLATLISSSTITTTDRYSIDNEASPSMFRLHGQVDKDFGVDVYITPGNPDLKEQQFELKARRINDIASAVNPNVDEIVSRFFNNKRPIPYGYEIAYPFAGTSNPIQSGGVKLDPRLNPQNLPAIGAAMWWGLAPDVGTFLTPGLQFRDRSKYWTMVFDESYLRPRTSVSQDLLTKTETSEVPKVTSPTTMVTSVDQKISVDFFPFIVGGGLFGSGLALGAGLAKLLQRKSDLSNSKKDGEKK